MQDISLQHIIPAGNGVLNAFVMAELSKIERDVRELRQACDLAGLTPALFNHRLRGVTMAIEAAQRVLGKGQMG